MAHTLNNQQANAVLADNAEATPAQTAALSAPHDLSAMTGPWLQLLQRSCEPSFYAHPGWLLPMLQHTAGHSAPVIIATRCPAADRITGIYPFIRKTWRWLLPIPILSTWDNDFFFTGLPLAPRAATRASLSAMLHAARHNAGAHAVMFQQVPADGPFIQALDATADDLGLPVRRFDPFERAGLITGQDFDTWFQQNFQRKRRKEFRRLRSRLSEEGNLQLITHQHGEPVQPWVDEFTALERAGWKGRRGTAIACADHMVTFLSDALNRLDGTKDLLAWKLCLDGKPIAMLFAMVSGNRAWLGKIAYNEAYARFSPGVLLILDATADLLARNDIEQVDSSAIPDHPMINRIWRDRLAMTDVMVATPETPSWAFALMAAAEQARRKARATAKSAYYRFLKGKGK
jgi:CelD/BcsL family acetyltransferase involved in cellulose biosynthesis